MQDFLLQLLKIGQGSGAKAMPGHGATSQYAGVGARHIEKHQVVGAFRGVTGHRDTLIF